MLFSIKAIKFISRQFQNKRFISTLQSMACSRYEYVKSYERDDGILPNVWIVVRVDGKGFHKFSKVHDFDKPNDERGMVFKAAKRIEQLILTIHA